MNARLCTFILILGASAACFGQESLGDVARAQRAAERPKAKRVVTNENLPHASPSEAANGAVVLPKAPESKNEGPKADAKSADKKQASIVMSPGDAQKKLDELKGNEEAQLRALRKFEEELKDESIGPERRQMFQEGLQTARQMLDEIAADRDKIEKALAAVAAASDGSKKQESASAHESGRDERPAETNDKKD